MTLASCSAGCFEACRTWGAAFLTGDEQVKWLGWHLSAASRPFGSTGRTSPTTLISNAGGVVLHERGDAALGCHGSEGLLCVFASVVFTAMERHSGQVAGTRLIGGVDYGAG